ncbi:MAG: ceramidase domain-containing protein [Devosia sp.]
MDWTRAIDNYCERMSPDFWAEPVNALTNFAFVAAAVYAGFYAARKGALDWAVFVLVVLALAVGVGSFLFHTVAEVWSLFADVIPIQLFIVFYFALAMRRFAGLPVWAALLITLGFLVGSFMVGGGLSRFLGDALNGSEGYLAPLAALLVVGAALIGAERKGAGWSLVGAAFLFAVSLTFRTVDEAVCPAFSLGTHFAWHLLNGLLLGWLVIAMARFGEIPRPRSA